jgi:hypothetical protein
MSNLVVQSNLLPAPAEFQTLKEIASMAVKSGLLPSSIKSPEQAVIIALKGRELGIPPMVAFSQISVINGKPCISAELMLSQIHQKVPSASINFIKNDNESCVIEAIRKNCKPSTWSFTIEDAKSAQLLGKQVWKQYPAAMLRARAISAMARAVFPDALNGVSYTPEEMGAEVEIDDQGMETIKDITPVVGEKETKHNVMTSLPPANEEKKTEAAVEKPGQTSSKQSPPNNAPQTRLDAYRTTFSFGTFPPGKTFKDLGIKDTTNLLNSIKAWKLKKESEGGKIPSLCEEFIGLAEEWLEREKA